MIPACFARALQRGTSRLCMHFLLTFQEVMPISKTRNQLQERGKKQGLKAAQQGEFAMMQQRKILLRMALLIGLDGLLELGHHRREAMVLVEPMRKEMHADTRQTGQECNDFCPKGLPR